MRFPDLAAEHESNARALRLGGKERYEEVRRVEEPGAVVFHPDFEAFSFRRPAWAVTLLEWPDQEAKISWSGCRDSNPGPHRTEFDIMVSF